MPDITVTAASVLKGSSPTTITNYNAGETITAGQAVYRKLADNEWYKAQADGTAEESGVGTDLGIALHGSADGQPLVVQTGGTITIGATVVAGTEYVVSATAGGIAPHADLVATNKYSRLGYATTTGVIQLVPLATGITLA